MNKETRFSLDSIWLRVIIKVE